MPFYKLTLAYDGTHFVGWQWQAKGRTVQATLEGLIERITGTFSRVAGSSRTDAGVHALGQVAGFYSDTRMDTETLRRALNAYAPADLVILKAEFADEDFHATRDATAKRYRYVVQDGGHRDVFARQFAWRVWQRLDVETMQQAAQLLVGTHDFVSFQTSGSKRTTTVRTIRDISVRRPPVGPQSEGEQGRGGGLDMAFDEAAGRVWIEVEADGFLYNMVRNIAGTLVAVGKGRHPIEWVAEVLAARDRRAAGMTAPAEGLFLMWVQYESGQRPSAQFDADGSN